MAYAALSDINGRMAPYFTAGPASVPSETAVLGWRDEFEAHVNSALATAGYTTVPATGANDIVLLRGIVADATALKTLHVALGAGNIPQEVYAALTGGMSFKAAVTGLANGTTLLVDQRASQSTLGIGFMDLFTDERSLY